MFRYLAAVVALATVLGTVGVSADSGEIRKIDSLEYRGLGGVDLALDSRILSNSASGEDWKFSIFNLEAIGNWKETDDAIGLYSIYSIMLEFKEPMLTVLAINEKPAMDFDMRARAEPIRVSWGTEKFGRLTVGLYNETEMSAHNAPIDMKGQPLIQDGIYSYMDFTGTPDISAMAVRSDIGGFLGYARAFELPLDMEVSAGAQVRVMHRWLLPITTARVDGRAGFATLGDAFKAPDFNIQSGNGLAVDFSATLALHDPILDTRVAATAENFGAVWYDGDSQTENSRYSVGAVVTPLHAIEHDCWKFGTDFENLQDGLTWQVGTLYTLGNSKFSVSPRVGYIRGEKDMFSRPNDFVTAGLSAGLRGFNVRAVYEYNLTFKLHSIGIGVEMTF